MVNSDLNGAGVREFLEYRTPHSGSLYSMGADSCVGTDDAFLETAEILGNSKEFFLHNRTALMND